MKSRRLGPWWVASLLSLCVASIASGASLPLAEAVKQGDLAAIRALASRETVNATEADGSTALHWAAHRGDAAIVKVLLGAGAKVDVVTRYGVTPLALASSRGNSGVVELLLMSGAKADQRSSDRGETPLMLAARAGDVASIKLLLAHGADPNAQDLVDKQTPLMGAAAENNVGAIEALLEAGAAIAAMSGAPQEAKIGEITPVNRFSDRGIFRGFANRDVRSMSALHLAVQRGHLEATRALLAKGANIEQPTLPIPIHPLLIAIANGHMDLAAFLLDNGADPDAMLKEPTGWTALHQLARFRAPIEQNVPYPVLTGRMSSLDLAKKILERGANVNARMTVDSLPEGYRNRLDQRGATPFLLAAKAADPDLMRLLLTHGADPNLPTVLGTTPLMVAAGIGVFNPGEDFRSGPAGEPFALEAVKICLEQGANVNAVDQEGETALHGAAYLGRNSVAELLVAKGARLDPVNKVGWTPVRIADGVQYNGHPKPQRHTSALLRRIMRERGMPVEDAVIENTVPVAGQTTTR